ncbi:MAG: PAS domain S-box protein [Anaerolinea sp.]|nr:PAS domain S-box protein [Anaerolinea sp.]
MTETKPKKIVMNNPDDPDKPPLDIDWNRLLSTAGLSIITTDLNGLITSFNRAAEQLYGHEGQDLMGEAISRLVHPYSRTDHDRMVWVITRENRTLEIQMDHLHADGRALGVRVAGSPLHNPQGAVIGMMFISVYVGEQTAIVGALQQERDVLEAILETTNDAILMIDPEGQILTMNFQFETFFRLQRYQLVGQQVDALIEEIRGRPDLPSDLLNLVVTFGLEGTRSGGGDFQIKEPVRRIVVWYSAPVHSHDGVVMGRLFVFQDATRERELDRMKTEFLSLISHELRTPLTSIMGFNEMLMDGDAGELAVDALGFLDIIRLNAHRLRVLIDDILDLTKIESGHVELRANSHELIPIINDVVRSMRPMLEARKQHLTIDLQPEMPRIWADRERLIQVLSNLLTNANKYTLDNGHVELRAYVVEDESNLPKDSPRGITLPAFLISVQDDGIGIDLKDQPSIFTSFFRTEEVSRRQIQGSGLGLTIVKSFVELHGGKIWLQSEGKDKGAAFFFTIPVVRGI